MSKRQAWTNLVPKDMQSRKQMKDTMRNAIWQANLVANCKQWVLDEEAELTQLCINFANYEKIDSQSVIHSKKPHHLPRSYHEIFEQLETSHTVEGESI